MDFRLELVLIPVSDVDRAKRFYTGQAGFDLLVDTPVGDEMRIVQVTPPGSACSIGFGTGLGLAAAPGSFQGLHLVVPDIIAARAELTGRGVDVTEVRYMDEGRWVPGGYRVPIRNAVITCSSPTSPTRTATAGCCRRSRGMGPVHDRDDRQRDWRAGGQVTTDHSDGLRTAAVAGKESAFAALSERHRRELHVHCYRMLASFDDAEDAVQETFLRAWRGRDRFDGGSLFRAWLYRIATNVCLDMLRRSSHRARRMHSFAEVPWLQPYPDRLLDEVAPSGEQPDAVVVGRETIELAFLAAMQVLPPRQRAAFIVRDVLGWPASETASLLNTSVAAANSALQRARATMQEHLPAQRAQWPVPELGEQERALLEQFIDAHERCDAAAAAAIAARDIRITMPPNPYCFDGLDAIAPLLERALGPDRDGDWRLVPTRANRMPTAASYLLRPGDSEFRAFKFDVLRIQDGVIAEITTFGAGLFPAFGLPPTL